MPGKNPVPGKRGVRIESGRQGKRDKQQPAHKELPVPFRLYFRDRRVPVTDFKWERDTVSITLENIPAEG